MAVGQADFGETLWPGINRWYGLDYKQFDEQYKDLFDVLSSTRAYEESQSLAGFGQIPVKPHGKSVAYADPAQGFKNRLINITYGLGFIIEKELYDDNQYEQVVRKFPTALSRSVKNTVNTVGALVYDRAFNSLYTGADGLEMCSAVHLKKLGGTWSNEPSVAADLAEESLRQALIDIADFQDDAGLKMNLKAMKLIVAPENDFRASKLLESSLETQSANNDINPAKGRMPYVVNNFLTNTKYWFIRTSCQDSLVFYWREKPDFTRDNDFDTRNAKYKTIYRMVCGWDDPRGIYGVPMT